MARSLTIGFPAAQVIGRAQLVEADAPSACDLLWGLLATPFVGRAVHAMYAGPAALVTVPPRHGEPRGGQIPVENETNQPAPGDVLLLPPDPTLTQDVTGVTLALFYGPHGRPLTPSGWVAGVKVGVITEGREAVLEQCRRLRFAGAAEVRLARVEAEAPLESAVLHADGSSLGNPGPAGAGFVLTDEGGALVAEGSIPLEPTTVNVAEYRALIAGLGEAQRRRLKRLTVRMDSELICRQLSGQYRVKSADLRPLYEQVRHLLRGFDQVSCEHVPREDNRRADELATAAARLSQERLEKNAD